MGEVLDTLVGSYILKIFRLQNNNLFVEKTTKLAVYRTANLSASQNNKPFA